MSRAFGFPKLVVIVNAAVPVLILGWDAYRHQLGVNGVNYAIHTTGLLGFIFLLLTLLVTPFRRLTGWSPVIAVRRALGLYAFFYLAVHFAIFFIFDRELSVPSTVHEIYTRTYLQLGTIGLVLLIPLAVTSTDAMVMRLGARSWKALHRLIYPIAILGAVHYYLLVKADVSQPLLFASALCGMLIFRVVYYVIDRRQKARVKAALSALDDATKTVAPQSKKPRFWKGQLKVARIWSETPDVRTFRLVSAIRGELGESELPFDYLPGQYLNLSLKIDGAPVRRSYTIASSPTRSGYCEVTVKREPQGASSRHLHDTFKEGSLLEVSAPAGRFVFTGEKEGRVALIAGGVGITPLMSMVRYLTDRSWSGEIDLFVCAKKECDIIFREELAYLARRFPNLHVVITLSREDSPDSAWSGAKGRLSKALLEPLLPKLLETPVFLCGPDEMMSSTKALLRELSVPDANVHTEAFISRPSPTSAEREGGVAPIQEADEMVDEWMPDAEAPKVRFDKSGKTAELSYGRTILEAAEEAGVDIPFECRSGICGQCKTKLIAGEVVMDAEDALSPKDKSKRFILACQARAARDVVVEA